MSAVHTEGATELLPCPFCGSSDIKAKQGKTLILNCQGCGAFMIDYENGVQRDVRAAWNTRAALSGWQPIETAPKDGTHILVSWPMRQMDDEDMPTGPTTRRDTLVTWMNGDSWIEPDYLGASGAWFGDEDCYAADPDLWMPLPTPPAPNQGAES
jgi:hypothetical protein